MIECIFTVDYEIYGNGIGSLRELVYNPAEALKAVFRKWNARCVLFVEVAELEIIRSERADLAIDLVEQQIRELHGEGFEVGLHLHPQWYNAQYRNGSWQLDYSEYNLCRLSSDRIHKILDRSIAYLQKVLAAPGYKPLSFRAGNWLLQPTEVAAKCLAAHGIRVDSSLFKGGLQHQYDLDYRRSRINGYYWPFSEDINVSDPLGILLEIPTFTKMVPMWKMFTAKRISLQQKSPAKAQQPHKRLARIRDFSRICHPMKLDFCRLTVAEMIRMFDREIKKNQEDPTLFRPIVAIGHTKDLIDLEAVDIFLSYLREKGVPISTFRDVHEKIMKRGEIA